MTDRPRQFAMIPNMFCKIFGSKSNIYEKGWSKFEQENSISDYFSVDWEVLLKIGELNADNSTKICLDKIYCY